MNTKALQLALIVIVFALLGAIVWVGLPIVQKLTSESENVQTTRSEPVVSSTDATEKLLVMQDIFSNGNPYKAVQYAEDQILDENIPMSAEQKTQLYFQMATAYIPVDYTRSIALFKTIVADEAATPRKRAEALRSLGDLYMLHSRAIEIVYFIFLDETYGQMVDLTDDLPIMHALRNMYEAVLEQGEEAGPQPIAHYRLAELYLEELFTGRVHSELRTETNLLAQAKHHYSEGVLDQTASTESYLDPTADSIYVNGQKALVTGYLALEEDNEEMHIQARDLYVRSLAQIADYTGPEIIADYFRGWVNLNYAIYLHESGGASDAIDDALQSIVSTHAGQNTTFTGWMWRLSDEETEFAGLRSKIVDVAQHNAAFADMLVNLGWTL